MKRFWKNVEIVTLGQCHGVKLDGRAVKLPSGNPFTTPFPALAEAIASEWANAPTIFSPDDLPLTRLASTAQERIAPHRADIIGQLAAYGMNDLLCYRAENPEELVIRQSECWGHWLAWAKARYGLHLLSTAGLMPISQPPGTSELLREILSSHSNDTIAALGVIVPALGSLILALSLAAGALTPQAACEAAFLDELWQEEQWGTDGEAVIRRTKLTEDLAVSARFIHLCGT